MPDDQDIARPISTGRDRSGSGLDAADNKKLHQLQIDAARAQTEDLAAEIDKYEQLLSGTTTSFSADSLSDLRAIDHPAPRGPGFLIQAEAAGSGNPEGVAVAGHQITSL